MIKISRLADYAVVVLAQLAQQDKPASSTVLAGRSHLPEPTVAKVLKLLARAGLLQSIRGINGGYQLTKLPTQIDIAQIITAVEGPVYLTACIEGAQDVCDHHRHCALKGRWDDVNIVIREALETVTLADMMTAPKCTTKETVIHERL